MSLIKKFNGNENHIQLKIDVCKKDLGLPIRTLQPQPKINDLYMKHGINIILLIYIISSVPSR